MGGGSDLRGSCWWDPGNRRVWLVFCFNKGFLLRNERFAESVEIFQLRNPFRIRSVEIPYLRFFFYLSEKIVLSRDVAPVGEDTSEAKARARAPPRDGEQGEKWEGKRPSWSPSRLEHPPGLWRRPSAPRRPARSSGISRGGRGWSGRGLGCFLWAPGPPAPARETSR